MIVDTKKLWASRFKKETNELGINYSESITVDRHMVRQDIWGSQAHTIMLGYTGIVADDHVVLDTKLYARDQLMVVQSALAELINTFLELVPEHLNTIMPGYTHTQHAQPMTFAYWLTHYAAIFLRDL